MPPFEVIWNRIVALQGVSTPGESLTFLAVENLTAGGG